MTTTSALSEVKALLGLSSVSTFDTLLATLLQISTGRLFPDSGVEVIRQTVNITVDNYGEAIIDLSTLSTPCAFARRVEFSTGGAYSEVEDKYHQGKYVYLRQLPSNATTAYVYGISEFALTASDATTTIPTALTLGLYWYTMSLFYDQVGSSKADYNIYSQTSGARMVDNMRDESAYFEAKAKQYVMEQTNIYTS